MKNYSKNPKSKMFLEVFKNCIMKLKKEIEKYLSYRGQSIKSDSKETLFKINWDWPKRNSHKIVNLANNGNQEHYKEIASLMIWRGDNKNIKDNFNNGNSNKRD